MNAQESIFKISSRSIERAQKELADVRESTSLWAWLFNRKKDIFLKARLKNYLTLREFVTAPDRSKKFIEENLKTLTRNK